jgi:hypothetical protein
MPPAAISRRAGGRASGGGGIALVATHEPIAIAAAVAMAQRIELAG